MFRYVATHLLMGAMHVSATAGVMSITREMYTMPL